MQLSEPIGKAGVLIEALPYIADFRGEIIVVKLGGSVQEDERSLASTLTDVAFMHVVGMLPIVVHGGGKAITRALKEAAVETRFLNGFRVTDEASIAIVEDVIKNRVNARVVELLAAAGAMGLRVSFGYGLTETSSGVAISVRGDPFAMEICPDDTITLAEDGEILIEAPTCIMQGYYKMPEATAVLENGVLRTGDLGRFDAEGKLHITGRKKDMLVLPDGTKIFLPEYEARLMKALGHTELAVVMRGAGPLLVFSGEADKAELLEKLRPLMAELPRGQQLRDILITNEALPRTATGKIKRWELQQKVGMA